MKKILALFILFGTLIIGSTYAASIGDVALRFCNNSGSLEKTISLTTSGQEKKEICMMLVNGSYEPVNITLSFVDGTITNDTDQKKACKNEGENENFGKYMKLEKNIVTVPGRGSTIFTGILELPEEAAGEIHGCATYFVQDEKTQKDMFTVMVRRANFIDVFAKGVVTVGLSFADINSQTNNLSKNPKILSFFKNDEGKLYIQANLKNKGTAEQGVTIRGEIKSRLGYKKIFFEEKRTLFAKQESIINNVIDELPFYKGPFQITYSVEYNANIAEGLQTDTTEKNGIISESASIFIFGTGLYICLAILAIVISGIIFVIVRKKSHKKQAKKSTKRSHK